MSASTATGTAGERVTIDEIRASLRNITRPVAESVDEQRERAKIAGVVAVAAVVIVVYWLGRRSGRKRQTILEIRRI